MKESTKNWVTDIDRVIDNSLVDEDPLRLKAMKYAKTKSDSFRLQAMLIDAYIEGNKQKEYEENIRMVLQT